MKQPCSRCASINSRRASGSRYAGLIGSRSPNASRMESPARLPRKYSSSNRAWPTGSNVGFGMKRNTLLSTTIRGLPPIVAHVHQPRAVRGEVPRERVRRLVVVVVGVESVEVDGSHAASWRCTYLERVPPESTESGAKLPAWRTGGRNRHSRASDGCRCGRRSSIATDPGSALDGRWRFSLAARSGRRSRRLHRCRRSTTAVGPRSTFPAVWTMQGFDRPIYTNSRCRSAPARRTCPTTIRPGCYRTRFTVPDEWRGRRVVLHVGAAESVLRVWVNGRAVGIEQGHAARGRVRRDRARAVRREQRARRRWSCAGPTPSYVEDQDQWWHAGHRTARCSSTRTPRTRIADVHATASLADDRRPARSPAVEVGFAEARGRGLDRSRVQRRDPRRTARRRRRPRGRCRPTARAVRVRRPRRASSHVDVPKSRRGRPRTPDPVPGAWSRCSTPTATCARSPRAPVGFRRDRDPRPRAAAQRRAGAVPRREPPRLRPGHRARS